MFQQSEENEVMLEWNSIPDSAATAGLVKYEDPDVGLGSSYDGIRLDAGDGVSTPSNFYVLFTKDDDLQVYFCFTMLMIDDG